MRFTRRDMMMIEYLRDYEVLELDSMSEYLGVSVKTLKNQLKELAEILKEFGVDIRFVSGNQLMVRGHEKFAEVMSMSIPRFEMEFERRFLLLLVLHDNFLTIQEIADELLVSKSYAEKHLASIMKKYPEDIQAQRHYGIRYAASQNKRREVFVKILFPYLFGEDYIVALEQFDSLHFPLFHYFTNMQTAGIQKDRLRYRKTSLIRRNLTDYLNGFLAGVRNLVCPIQKKNCAICIRCCYHFVNKKLPVRIRSWRK